MRTIKFRGKRIDNGEWVYGYYVGYSKSMGYIYGDYVDRNEVWQVDANTIGQYTGLNDKNGKEIYEGDIVKDFNNNLVEVGFGVVEYIESNDSSHEAKVIGFYLKYSNDYKIVDFNELYQFELIGNIHEVSDNG